MSLSMGSTIGMKAASAAPDEAALTAMGPFTTARASGSNDHNVHSYRIAMELQLEAEALALAAQVLSGGGAACRPCQ